MRRRHHHLNHHLTNDTSDTLRVGFEPKNRHRVGTWTPYGCWRLGRPMFITLWLRGKCHDCTPYEALPYGIDSMWVDNRTLAVDLLDSALWEVHVDSLSWILHDRT